MASEDSNSAPRFRARATLYALALSAFFCASYGLANRITANRSHVGSIVFPWESHVPFLPWTIVPYWSIDLFYLLSFFTCRTRAELDQHTRRLLAAQFLCVTSFLLFPLRFASARPETHGISGALFTALTKFDGPFNQAPSLHLSLAVILAAKYFARLTGAPRWLVVAWFALIGVSVLTTYQHHFIDVPTGIWAGLLCCAAFPADQEFRSGVRRTPSLRLTTLYAGAFLFLTVLAVRAGSYGWWLLYPAGACLIVSGIYAAGDPRLFRKRRGALQPAMQWLLAPYTLAAWLNSRWWTRHEPPATEVTDGVWLGRIPTGPALRRSGFLSMLDLTAELPARTDRIQYCNVPMLDLVEPSPEQLDEAVAAIESLRAHRPTLVCCALGYSRSASAVAAWLVATGRANDWNGAVAILRRRRKHVRLTEVTA
jgi:protein-tyrosine phosphatase